MSSSSSPLLLPFLLNQQRSSSCSHYFCLLLQTAASKRRLLSLQSSSSSPPCFRAGISGHRPAIRRPASSAGGSEITNAPTIAHHQPSCALHHQSCSLVSSGNLLLRVPLLLQRAGVRRREEEAGQRTGGAGGQRRTFFRGQEHGYGFKIIKSGQTSKWDVLLAGATLSVLAYLFVDVRHVYEAIAPAGLVQVTDEYWNKGKKSLKKMLKLDAAAIPSPSFSLLTDQASGEKEKEEVKAKAKVGFRERKIIEYENRIRTYSTPDKIFRYFATIKVVTTGGGGEESTSTTTSESEVMMTPEDFLRSLTPGARQPDNLCLDQFRKIEVRNNNNGGGGGGGGDMMRELDDMLMQEKKNLSPDSIFYKLSDRGLISFTDFLFLLTVLSVSRRHFEIAFRMFDLNGDGDVDYDEFARVQSAIMSQTSMGQKLDRTTKSNTSYRGVSSALSKYFFGKDLSRKLTIDTFTEFQSKLQHEILLLEFNGKDPKEGRISELDFADLMIAYAGFPESKKQRMLKRIRKRFKSKSAISSKQQDTATAENGSESSAQVIQSIGITESEYTAFHHFLQNINDVDIALTFFKYGTQGIDACTLKHAAATVAQVRLSDHMVDVIFTLFDEDQDGYLSNREFVSVMKERVRRGLSRPKDTGFTRIVTSAFVNSFKFQGIFL